MSDALAELGEIIAAAQPEAVVSHQVNPMGELTLTAAPAGIRGLAAYLRDNTACAFTTLLDITGIDWPGREKRFDVVYHFLSMPQNQRLRVRLEVGEEEMVPSITDLFPAANWYERETFDMYGVMFSGHPDLRRLLSDYGFVGHPLRKDFPTTGYVELRYDETVKRVVYEPVKLVQDYRLFEFMSPWEGAQYILPGDEKASEKAGGKADEKAGGKAKEG